MTWSFVADQTNLIAALSLPQVTIRLSFFLKFLERV